MLKSTKFQANSRPGNLGKSRPEVLLGEGRKWEQRGLLSRLRHAQASSQNRRLRPQSSEQL